MLRDLSVQLYTVRKEMSDREGTLRRLASIGYRAVEPFRPTDDPHGLRALVDDLGLRVSGAHCALLREDAAPLFEAAKVLGTDHLIVPAALPHQAFTTREGIELIAGRLNALSRQAAREDLLVGYHNHWWEFEPKIAGRSAMEVLVDLLDPAVFLEVDTYWAAVAGADVVSVLHTFGERVHALHVKDGPLVKGEPNTAVGAGAMPIADIVAAAPQAQLVVELDSCSDDVMTALAASHDTLSAMVAGVR